MSDPLTTYWVHELAIARYTGVNASGKKTYAPLDDPLPRGWIDDRATLVRGPDGSEVTSSTRVFLPIGTDPVPLDSKVTLPATHGARTATVLAVSVHHGGGLETPDHIELALT